MTDARRSGGRVRWTWFFVIAGLSTLVIAALVAFAGFNWWRVLAFGWLPLVLVELFAALYAGRPEDRRRWPAFGAIVAAGLLVSAWLAFFEGIAPARVLLFATLPFIALMLVVTLFVRRRVAPFRVVQVISAVVLNAYILAYLQDKILYQGFFKHIPQPILNCYGGPLAVFACPIGSTQQMIGMRTIPWLALGAFIVVGALVGRAACAWICPFGLWQDLLQKVPVGRRAKAKKWLSFGVIAGVAAVAGFLLVALLKLAWWQVLLFGWLPFAGALLAVALTGKFDVPRRLWVGSFLVAVGIGALTWLRFGAGFGVVAGFAGILVLGLSGGWVAAAIAVPAAFLLGWLGPAEFAIGPLSGFGLGIALAAAAGLVILLLDRLAKVSLPSTTAKYAVLLLVAGLASYLTIEPWFCKLCPQGTLGAGIPLVLWDPVNALRGLVGWLYWVKVGFLLLVVVAAIGIKRPFCRLVCPIGAVYALFNKVSLLRMEVVSDRCTSCTLCQRVCPMNISAYQDPNQAECIRCFECVWNCKPSGLRIRA
ncbi:MAG: 4Fe-4S binding protein [bacterium]